MVILFCIKDWDFYQHANITIYILLYCRPGRFKGWHRRWYSFYAV